MAEDVTNLIRSFDGPPPIEGTTGKHEDVTDLVNSFDKSGESGSKVIEGVVPVDHDISPEERRAQFGRGVRNVLDTISHYGDIAYTSAAKPFVSAKKAEQMEADRAASDEARKTNLENFRAQNGPDKSGSEYAGEMVATAPLMPAKAISLWKGAVGALPTVTAAGGKILAPLTNRLAGAIGEGALGGATYGAATSQGDDRGFLPNVAEGTATGAVAGPILHGLVEAGTKLPQAITGIKAYIAGNKIAQNAGIEGVVATNVITRLQEAGFTIPEAKAYLAKLGPKATLADLAQSLQAESTALAQSGNDRATALLKGRMEARQATHNTDVNDIIEKHLGPQTDLEAEKAAMKAEARKDVGPDYRTAHNNPVHMDVNPILDHIDNEIENNSINKGEKAKVLGGIRQFFERDLGKDPVTGKTVTAPIDTVKELHGVREELDNIIEGRNPTNSVGSKTLESLKEVRSQVDAQLKLIPEMASADARFEQHMKNIGNLQIGYDAVKRKMPTQQFLKAWQLASPAGKEALKKGMRTAIGEYVETAGKGELSGATQLLGARASTRSNARLAYGVHADAALDALEKEANMKNTEQKIIHGSQTASNRAIGERYQAKGNAASAIFDPVSNAVDYATGVPIATGTKLATRFGSKIINNKAVSRLSNLIEGTADVLSQSGKEIQGTLDTLEKVAKVQSKKAKTGPNRLTIPSAAIAPLGEFTYEQRKKIGYR